MTKSAIHELKKRAKARFFAHGRAYIPEPWMVDRG